MAKKLRTTCGSGLPAIIFGLCIVLIFFFARSLHSRSEPLHVYCLCQNQWVNGQVTNHAEVELRDGTSFGPVITDAEVSVNEQRLSFDQDAQSYQGSIGEVEQWQRIPISIRTRDGRTIRGYAAVVFLVEFAEPIPWAEASLSHPLPLKWEYSEGSMHTVDLLAWKENEEPQSHEVAGNSTTIDLRRISTNLRNGDVVHIQVLPFRTSNYELDGYITKRSKAEFLTTAVISVKIVG